MINSCTMLLRTFAVCAVKVLLRPRVGNAWIFSLHLVSRGKVSVFGLSDHSSHALLPSPSCLPPTSRYFIRKTDPVYGYWFYHMYQNVVLNVLATIHPGFHVKNSADIDALLDCTVRV